MQMVCGVNSDGCRTIVTTFDDVDNSVVVMSIRVAITVTVTVTIARMFAYLTDGLLVYDY